MASNPRVKKSLIKTLSAIYQGNITPSLRDKRVALWLDTSGPYPVLKTRNAAGTAWTELGGSVSGSGGSETPSVDLSNYTLAIFVGTDVVEVIRGSAIGVRVFNETAELTFLTNIFGSNAMSLSSITTGLRVNEDDTIFIDPETGPAPAGPAIFGAPISWEAMCADPGLAPDYTPLIPRVVHNTHLGQGIVGSVISFETLFTNSDGLVVVSTEKIDGYIQDNPDSPLPVIMKVVLPIL